MRNLQILIVSVVKICKQCLRIASASEGPSTGASPLDPISLDPRSLWAITPHPQMKIPSGATDVGSDFSNGQISKPQRRKGMHLLYYHHMRTNSSSLGDTWGLEFPPFLPVYSFASAYCITR